MEHQHSLSMDLHGSGGELKRLHRHTMMLTEQRFAATQMTLNPDMGPTEANMWIDEIQGYTAPRLALAMGLATSWTRMYRYDSL